MKQQTHRPCMNGRKFGAPSHDARPATPLVLALLCLPALSGCGSTIALLQKPTEPAAVELVPAPRLKQYVYKKILLLPPEKAVEVRDFRVKTVSEKTAQYYMAKLEKALLQKGFQVISPEIVARADQGAKDSKNALSAAEKAMIMGQQTEADAVFIVQSIAVQGMVKYFAMQDEKAVEVEPGMVRINDEFEAVHVQTGQCLFALPYYEVRLEAKLVEAASGAVLWVGTGRQRSTDVLRQDWSAELNNDCKKQRENFIYSDFLGDEQTLDKIVAALLDRMLTPLQADASAGQPLETAKAPPSPAPPLAVEPKVKTAVVSAKVSTLREGPGKEYPKKMQVTRKAKVEVLEVMGEWIKVKLQDGVTGWMHESTLIINE